MPRKIRAALDELLEKMRAMPSRMRQYAAYEHVQTVLKNYRKSNAVVVDMKSEAIRERHWRQLIKRLRATWSLGDLTLGDLYASDMVKNERVFREVIQVAQGEMALESSSR